VSYVCVVTLVDNLIQRAIQKKASDIHLESTANNLRVRFRLDGILHDQDSIEKSVMDQVISRIKVLSNIDTSKNRIPQDGKFTFEDRDRTVDLRVSTFPTIYGQKCVIRILDNDVKVVQLEQLGFDEDTLFKFLNMLNKSTGFILVTGPTGSGKTTTLYGAISYLNSKEKNIITLEDPVEYCIDGVCQGQINNACGFTFEKGIRSLLRQDPDIAMIGEIRDKESAKIAIEAALTGHLVFSTLHTNDAPSAIIRLMDMGIEPFLINASLSGVLAQRLVRKLCDCKEPFESFKEVYSTFSDLIEKCEQIYKPVGCFLCDNTGYKGRLGIFELLQLTDDLKSLIKKNPCFDSIYNQALKDNMKILRQDALNKVEKGITSMEEILRVIN
jgi:type II secretory ATPase GspE/PulE/Tfp pilus assembly ATPase PilB-like protein